MKKSKVDETISKKEEVTTTSKIDFSDSIDVKIFEILTISRDSGIPVLLLGNPGISKTTATMIYAEVNDFEVCLLRGNSETPETILGYDVSPSDNKVAKSAIHLRPEWFNILLENEKKGKKTLLFLDELTTANKFVQAALLQLIFGRTVGTEKLPEDTLVVAAGNYQENLSSEMDLLPPLMNRFILFNITPTKDDLKHFLCKYEGSLLGSKIDLFETLRNEMISINNRENFLESRGEEFLNKFGEFLEIRLRRQTATLIKEGKLDLSVTELSEIYGDSSEIVGSIGTPGFVTLRSLNYLRDVIISAFKLFGYDFFNDLNISYNSNSTLYGMVYGLVGIGLTYDKSKKSFGNRVVKNNITTSYLECIENAIVDAKKINNDVLSNGHKFMKEFIDRFNKANPDRVFKNYETASAKGVVLETEELSNLDTKLSKYLEDPSLNNVKEPYEINQINKVIEILGKNLTMVLGKNHLLDIILSASSSELLKSIKKDDKVKMGFVTVLNYWNLTAPIINLLGKLVIIDNKCYPNRSDRDSFKGAVDESIRGILSNIIQFKRTLMAYDPKNEVVKDLVEINELVF